MVSLFMDMAGKNAENVVWIRRIACVFPAAEDIQLFISIVLTPPSAIQTNAVPAIMLKNQHTHVAVTHILFKKDVEPNELS